MAPNNISADAKAVAVQVGTETKTFTTWWAKFAASSPRWATGISLTVGAAIGFVVAHVV